MIDWTQDNDNWHYKIVGQFVLEVRKVENGYFWSVFLPGDEGDSDTTSRLEDAFAAVEDAMELIVDEMFYEIELNYSPKLLSPEGNDNE